MVAALLAGLAALLTGGCAPSLAPEIKGLRGAWAPVRVAVFLPTEPRNLPSGGEYLDDAPEVVREAVAKELLRRGCLVASDSAIDSLVDGTVGNHDLSFGQAAEIAGKVGADVALVGKLYRYRRGSLFGPSSNVAMREDVVAVDGQKLGTILHYETAAQEDPALLARDVSTKIAASMDSAWGGCLQRKAEIAEPGARR